MKNKFFIVRFINLLFGVVVLAAGIINTLWGNDPFFGVFLILLSLIYLLPLNEILTKNFGFSIHWAIKVILGIFIFWAVIGVGELFDKIDIMMADLQRLAIVKDN